MKSLLNKSLSQFIVCTVGVLLLATPLFFLLTRHYYAEDLLEVIESVRNGESIPAMDLEEDIFMGMLIQFVLIFVVLSISMVIVMRFWTRRMWHPFNDTLQKIESFDLEQKELPYLQKSNIREFEQLNESVSRLMQKNRDTYQSQKEFTENASHELQTPIAIFQSKLDLLLQENLNEKQSALVSDLYVVSNRLGRLNRNLLLLAKIENRQYEKMERVNLPEYLQKNISLCRDLYGDRIRMQVDGSPVVSANLSLLESVVNNLVANAFRHRKTDSAVEIAVGTSSLSVSNESEGEALDENTVFSRFCNNKDENRGNGLGLAIVKAVCDYHGWGIHYYFKEGVHVFRIDF